MYALVDCNDFYASCERVFQPELLGRPLLVLSNNDGCVIALSEEAEDLGFEMGTPYFEIRDRVEQHDVAVRSSNYTLYGDLSERIRETLQQFTPRLEYYSIDEMFMDLSGLTHRNLTEYGRQVKQTVEEWTGVPVSLGIGPTKTLTKVAMERAKVPDESPVQNTTDWTDLSVVLDDLPIGDVWGIGPAYAETCRSVGIETAEDLRQADPSWVRNELTVTGLRRKYELMGQPCIPLEDNPDTKDNTCSSQIFGQKLTEFEPVRQAVVDYATRAARRIRDQDLCANMVSVFIKTSRFEDGPRYANRTHQGLNQPTDSTHVLASAAVDCLQSLYRDGYRYHKAGVFLHDLVPREAVQRSMLQAEANPRDEQLMEAVDEINREHGRGTLELLGSGGAEKTWRMNQDNLSRRYTTRWEDLPTAKAGIPDSIDQAVGLCIR